MSLKISQQKITILKEREIMKNTEKKTHETWLGKKCLTYKYLQFQKERVERISRSKIQSSTGQEFSQIEKRYQATNLRMSKLPQVGETQKRLTQDRLFFQAA